MFSLVSLEIDLLQNDSVKAIVYLRHFLIVEMAGIWILTLSNIKCA